MDGSFMPRLIKKIIRRKEGKGGGGRELPKRRQQLQTPGTAKSSVAWCPDLHTKVVMLGRQNPVGLKVQGQK